MELTNEIIGNTYTNTYDEAPLRELLSYIYSFCDNNKVSHKLVNETLVIYSDDRDKINSSNLDAPTGYIPFLAYRYNVEDEIYQIEFDPEMEKEMTISSIESIEKELLNIKHTDHSKFYYSEEELELKNAETVIRNHKFKEAEKASNNFENELKNLRISEEEFLKVYDLYRKTL